MSTPERATSAIVQPVCVAILLAAGQGRRFDASGKRNKLLVGLGATSVAETTVANIQGAGLPVVAVVAPGADALSKRLAALGCAIVICDEAGSGIGHSLASGARALMANWPTVKVALVCLADMPFIQSATYAAVSAHALSPIADSDGQGRPALTVAAAFEGVRGNPVAFSATLFGELASLSGDSGASALLRRHPPRLVDAGDSAVLKDIDRPDDLPVDDSTPPATTNFWTQD